MKKNKLIGNWKCVVRHYALRITNYELKISATRIQGGFKPRALK
nr:MAG TPA: hypothetical protein [Caudoviricetes sp.]